MTALPGGDLFPEPGGNFPSDDGRTIFETLAASAPLSVVEGRNFRVVQRAFPSFAVAHARFAGQLPVIHQQAHKLLRRGEYKCRFDPCLLP
jgi:hypothetical protein